MLERNGVDHGHAQRDKLCRGSIHGEKKKRTRGGWVGGVKRDPSGSRQKEVRLHSPPASLRRASQTLQLLTWYSHLLVLLGKVGWQWAVWAWLLAESAALSAGWVDPEWLLERAGTPLMPCGLQSHKWGDGAWAHVLAASCRALQLTRHPVCQSFGRCSVPYLHPRGASGAQAPKERAGGRRPRKVQR